MHVRNRRSGENDDRRNDGHWSGLDALIKRLEGSDGDLAKVAAAHG